MLAKVWKKVLLAVCIIACIFNIMSKLVNRHSLKENLESANDGQTVFSIFQKDEVVESESEPIIDGVMNPEPTTTEESNTSVVSNYGTNEVKNNIVVTEENAITEETSENLIEENPVEENVTSETKEETTTEEEKSGTFKFSDFTILF